MIKSHPILYGALALCIWPIRVNAQTHVNLRSQGQNVDFSQAVSTRPSKTGTALPAHCAVGEFYFKTDAAVGRNIYGCTAVDVWSLQTASGSLPDVTGNADQVLSNDGAQAGWRAVGGDVSGAPQSLVVGRIQGRPVTATAPADGQALVWSQANTRWQPQTVVGGGGGGGGASMVSQLGDFQVVWSSSTVLTIGPNCSNATPCSFRFGNTVYTVTSSATATLAAGTPGIAYFYLTSDGVLNVGHNLVVTCSGGCIADASITAFPANSIPLYAWTALGGAWDAAGGRDYRAHVGADYVVQGTGISTVALGTNTSVGVDTAVVPTYLTAAATLDFPSTANSSCSAELTITLAGAATGDSIAAGLPAALPAGLFGVMRVTAANSVGVKICNLSGGTVDPAAMVYRATILRSF
jgi:hypothetical protein